LFIYKGYTDQGRLDQQLLLVDHYTLGNFCVIAIDRSQQKIRIVADRYRSFPIYFENRHWINNLEPLSGVAWTDIALEIDYDLNIVKHKVDVIGQIDTTLLTYESALDQVHAILTNKTRQFLDNNTLPLKVFLSGGVDTLLVYSYLANAGAEFELIDYAHLEHDYFWRSNHHSIQSNCWAYKQIHHWRNPCVLASGAPGDVFMLRSTAANLYLRRNNTSIPQLLDQFPNCLHYSYFNRDKHQKIFQQHQNTDQDTSDWALCNIVSNDWQHWHLGNTLTWTPLRDVEIIKIMLRMPLSNAINQIMDSEFSKHLVERNTPGATRFISEQKNTGSVLKNLNLLFD
jgi:hypothetical protein